MTGTTLTADIPNSPKKTTRHATCVVAHGKGVLIVGASGSGKSSLALAMMGLGAKLIADDQVILCLSQNNIVASAPTAIKGLIEARGLGLLRAKTEPDARIKLVIDLDQTEHERLPPVRKTKVLDQTVPLLFGVDTLHFPAAVMQYLADGRQA
jgi:HPr kinase/phosphorylase